MTEKAKNDIRSAFEFLGDVKFYLDEAVKHEDSEMGKMQIRCVLTEVKKLIDQTFEMAKHEKGD